MGLLAVQRVAGADDVVTGMEYGGRSRPHSAAIGVSPSRYSGGLPTPTDGTSGSSPCPPCSRLLVDPTVHRLVLTARSDPQAPRSMLAGSRTTPGSDERVELE
jgi:hypothetical protein